MDRSHYIKDYAPSISSLSSASTYEPATVRFRVEILSLDGVRELGRNWRVQFRLTMKWLDPRLTFHNLKVRGIVIMSELPL